MLLLGGVFRYFLFSSLFGEDSHFDYSSNGWFNHQRVLTASEVVFDHRRYNGKQIVELLLENRDRLCSIEGPYIVNEFMLVRPTVPQPTQARSLQDLLNISIMEGPKLRMPMREIYHEFSKIFQADFVMYVDVAHLFARETCFLRFTVRWNEDFDQQWHQVAWRT